jgi:hypothetical protein
MVTPATSEFLGDTVAAELADTIATELFQNGQGEEAIRLQIKLRDSSDGVPAECDGGGWCRRAVVGVIARHLAENSIVGELQAYRILDAAGRIDRT